jgi:PhzF family phenazine biosynthesis protein
MKLNLFQIDTFTNEVFKGNPAAVIPLETWLPNETLQCIAQENNLSETAFFLKKNSYYEIRWFTPFREVNLCGHATLAAAFVIIEILNYHSDKITFESKSGRLIVEKKGSLFKMDFPSQKPEKCNSPKILDEALGVKPLACYFNEDYVAIFENEELILNIKPNFHKLKKIDTRGVIITAPGVKYDFVSRAFFPRYGINEDPVTGSAHTKLIPYWFQKTGKSKYTAKQLSKRGGKLICEYNIDRVIISGTAVLYMNGNIEV